MQNDDDIVFVIRKMYDLLYDEGAYAAIRYIRTIKSFSEYEKYYYISDVLKKLNRHERALNYINKALRFDKDVPFRNNKMYIYTTAKIEILNSMSRYRTAVRISYNFRVHNKNFIKKNPLGIMEMHESFAYMMMGDPRKCMSVIPNVPHLANIKIYIKNVEFESSHILAWCRKYMK